MSIVSGEMPQPADICQYLHTNYSLINENGLWSADVIDTFSRADAYSNTTNPYAYRREWHELWTERETSCMPSKGSTALT